jgi:hypothetical protein
MNNPKLNKNLMNPKQEIKKCTQSCESAQRKIAQEIKSEIKRFETELLLDLIQKTKAHD